MVKINAAEALAAATVAETKPLNVKRRWTSCTMMIDHAVRRLFTVFQRSVFINHRRFVSAGGRLSNLSHGEEKEVVRRRQSRCTLSILRLSSIAVVPY